MRSLSPYARSAMLLGGATLMLSVPFHLRPDNFCVDDGYFYPQIARHIVQGHGSTFNGWLPTNGYHPLWMLFCCLCALTSTRSTVLLQLATCLQDVMLAGSVVIIAWLAWRDRMRTAFLGCILLWFVNDVLGIWRLLETDLALLLQLLVLLLVTRSIQANDRRRLPLRGFGLGMLLGFTLLARLDLIFFAACILVYFFCERSRIATWPQRALQLCTACIAVVATMLPYLAWNFHRFGHLMPISGAIKNVFPHPHNDLLHNFLAPATLPVDVAAIFGVAMLFRRERTRFETAIMLTGISSGIHLVYTTAFSMAWPWYFTTGYLAFSLALIWTANQFSAFVRSNKWLEPLSVGAIACAFLFVAGIRATSNLTFTRFTANSNTLHDSHYVEPRRAFADMLRATYPPGTRFFIFDDPGSVAFYSGMSITPSDGLVGDYAWNDQLARDGYAAYARAHNMRRFICPILREGQEYHWLSLNGTRHGDTQSMIFTTPIGVRSTGLIELKDADLLLKTRTIQAGFESKFPQIGIWQYP